MSAVLREACFILREKASMHGDVCGPCSDCRLEPYLQALIRPRPTVPFAGVHPGVGLRWCGEEAAFEFSWCFSRYEVLPDGVLLVRDRGGDPELVGSFAQLVFDAGRRYERERG